MKQSTHSLNQPLRILAALVALLSWSQLAQGTQISGVISVDGTDTEGVLIVAYDCDNLAFLGTFTTGPTEIVDGVTRNYFVDVPSEHVRFDLFFKDDETDVLLTDYCRAYVVCGQIVPTDGKATVNYDMLGCNDHTVTGPGTSPVDYWKNPAVWPVDSLDIGGVTYTQAQVIARLKQPVKGDKSKNTFRELVAAKLNVLVGNDGSCVTEAIAAADAWLALHPFGSHIAGKSSTWKQINGTVGTLEDYNLGTLCAPPRGVTVTAETETGDAATGDL
jgi:hypothetical protein